MASKTKVAQYRPTANPEMHRAMVELRRSGATTPYSTLPKRERSRQDSKRADIKRGLDS